MQTVPEDPQFPSSVEAIQSGLQPQVNAPAPATSLKGTGLGLWLRDLIVSAAASVLIITFLYQPVRVEGTSMLPRLEDRDRLFINKFVYDFESIQRGDVVVFNDTPNTE